jgi:hypothetical protein
MDICGTLFILFFVIPALYLGFMCHWRMSELVSDEPERERLEDELRKNDHR